MSQSTTNLGDPSISTSEQPAHQLDSRISQSSKLLLYPGVKPSEILPPFKHQTLAQTLRHADPDVNLHVVQDILLKHIYGHASRELRAIYGVSPAESLRRVLARDSKYLYAYLKNAETNLQFWVEAILVKKGQMPAGAIYFEVYRIGEVIGKFARDMAGQIEGNASGVSLDMMTSTFKLSGIDDEELPF